ncbi:MAG: hypothetical protein IH991_13470 [Planctomycetes bacterium]|nr:hypothetical protein [Planctomycetota bacterium]
MATLRAEVFDDASVEDPRRDDIGVVLNACELRTGSSFRFGSRESRCWRFGAIKGNQVGVAEAVAASVAYPLLLPALDRIFTFVDREGREEACHRVLLTDGGVFDNLGTTCLEPGQDASIGSNTYEPEYIICCDAGPGQFDATTHPYGWATRMTRSFSTTHRQTQHGIQSRLHHCREHETINGFIYAYLGQIDNRLPYKPADLVPRDRVVNYPTDFSAMPEQDIDALSCRGEQLTRMLIEFYCPEL